MFCASVNVAKSVLELKILNILSNIVNDNNNNNDDDKKKKTLCGYTYTHRASGIDLGIDLLTFEKKDHAFI